MSHHLESPTSREDGRVNITELYVFPGEKPDTTVLIMNVNPDAGLSSPTTFHHTALYEFKIDTDGDAVENCSFRLVFGKPDNDGVQTVELSRVSYGVQAENVIQPIATGNTGEIIKLPEGGRLWAGLTGDPFFADGHALEVWQNALFKDNKLELGEFGKRAFFFGDKRNVSSIVLEIPNNQLQAENIAVWATTYIWKDQEWLQINRYGKPLIHIIFLRIDDHLVEHYNRDLPKDDREKYGEYFAEIISRASGLGGRVSDAKAYGQHVAEMLLPDVLPYRVGTAANYGFAGLNGRTLIDDVFDTMLSLVNNVAVNDGFSSLNRHNASFPFVPLAYTAEEQAGLSPYNPNGVVNPTVE